jgi:F420-non-reducing hydrogenase iron-sulfur subunit
MSNVVMLICSAATGALELARENGLAVPEAAVVEVPCSGRVDETTILRTLRQGARAVLVVGCLAGNCRFRTGNHEAHRNVDEAKSILEQIGLSPDRVEMVEIASVQYVRLVEAMRSMEERAERLGPIDLLEGDA